MNPRQQITRVGGALLCIALSTTAIAEEPDSCDCKAMAESVVATMRENYLGLPLIHARDERASREFECEVEALVARSSETAPEDCTQAISSWLERFHDGHLFLVESDRADTRFGADGAARLAELEWVPQKRGDPIEGRWFDEAGEIYAITGTDTSGEFFATAGDGAVAARFVSSGDGYHAIRVGSSGRLIHRDAAIRRGSLLHMAPVTWGRAKSASDPFRKIDATNPRAPILERLDETTMYISMPSHRPEFRPQLQSLVDSHHDDLVEAELLIIDLRGNEGGSSGTFNPLIPYVYAEPHRPPVGPKGPAMVLATPFMTRQFESWRKFWEEPPEWFEEMIKQISRHDGKLVPMNSPAAEDKPPDVVHDGPATVAVLLDSGSVSAAESTALWARRQSKVRLIGEPSGGSIDLLTVGLTRVGCQDWGYLLGLPTIAAGADIAERGLNRTGIPLDHRIDWAAEPDPLAAILRVLDDEKTTKED